MISIALSLSDQEALTTVLVSRLWMLLTCGGYFKRILSDSFSNAATFVFIFLWLQMTTSAVNVSCRRQPGTANQRQSVGMAAAAAAAAVVVSGDEDDEPSIKHVMPEALMSTSTCVHAFSPRSTDDRLVQTVSQISIQLDSDEVRLMSRNQTSKILRR